MKNSANLNMTEQERVLANDSYQTQAQMEGLLRELYVSSTQKQLGIHIGLYSILFDRVVELMVHLKYCCDELDKERAKLIQQNATENTKDDEEDLSDILN